MALSKPKATLPDPFQIGVSKPGYVKLFYPSSIGTLTAAALALSPTVLGRNPAILDALPRPLTRLPNSVALALVGFSAGFVATRTANWIRWKMIQRLLQYQGWIYGAKGIKTKTWAFLLKLLMGPGPAETYDFQRSLPKQPVPDLDQTLDLWLNVTAQLITKEEFEQTKEAVERFRQNEGPQLQKHLEKRYKNEVNWLSEYWSNIAYLASREPICMNSNYFLICKSYLEGVHQIDRAAGTIKIKMEFYELVANNRLPPVQLQGLVPLCMNGYRYIFGSTRIPGEHFDRIQSYPGETHVMIIRNGHYYPLEMYTGVVGQKNKHRLLTAQEIKLQLQRICKHADALPTPLPVASLTSQNRTTWAKHREMIILKNAETLKCVESALFVVSLEMQDIDPMDPDEHSLRSLTGQGGDRWFDKSFTIMFYPSGVYGSNVEHSGTDAMVITSLSEYLMVNESYTKDGLIPSSEEPNMNIPHPRHLSWNVEDMKDEIIEANTDLLRRASNLDVHILNTKYGKGYMKKCRLSPDGYIQMALQLAYYKLHKETPKTYEPSTTRLFALGRTENIHPMSAQSKAWVKVMCDPSSTTESRVELLKKAISVQTKARLQATVGQGCDRHLAGLYCASRELGMDVPAIFLDKAWQMPFKLSTSQTPTRTLELGAIVNYEWVNGGFVPGCNDGYGLCYILIGEDLINFSVTTYKSCEYTKSVTFCNAIEEALQDMKQLFSQ